MKVVAVSDTHTFEGDLGTLPEGDVLIHAGDLLRAGTLEELEPVAAWLKGQPHPYKIVVAGNHDGCFLTQRSEALKLLGDGIIYLQDSGVEIQGVRFWGSPWQPAYNDWAFNLPRGRALAERWARIPQETDVLITHCPPAGIGDASDSPERAGCADLLKRAQEVSPALHLFGHIHQDGGAWYEGDVCYANVSTWEGERGATIFELMGSIDAFGFPLLGPPSAGFRYRNGSLRALGISVPRRGV